MRLWALLLVCLVTAAAYAQGPMVTVQVSKAPLKKVLNEVERQTPYRFSYRSKLLDGQAPVTLNVRNVTVQTLLDQVLPQRNLGYRIVSAQSIVITAKTTPAPKASQGSTRSYTGVVRDAQGEPMIGASLSVGGKTLALTDAEGRFALTAPEGSRLHVSFIGYADQELVTGSDGNALKYVRAHLRPLYLMAL